MTLDIDSTVMTRSGVQQGARKGYNPRKPGRLSHRPLIAFVSNARMIANFWLRSGNRASANSAKGKQSSLFADDAFANDDPYAALATDLDLADSEGWYL